LVRSLWGEYHVHRPHFTGRPSRLGVMGSCKVYRPLFTGPPWQVPSQPISHYRPLLVRKMKKKVTFGKKIRFPKILCRSNFVLFTPLQQEVFLRCQIFFVEVFVLKEKKNLEWNLRQREDFFSFQGKIKKKKKMKIMFEPQL
jgi:hypothetical protein